LWRLLSVGHDGYSSSKKDNGALLLSFISF
jgi:hypothetical protein